MIQNSKYTSMTILPNIKCMTFKSKTRSFTLLALTWGFPYLSHPQYEEGASSVVYSQSEHHRK